MSTTDDEWKDRITFDRGRYAKLHVPSKKWFLFDRDGNNLASGKNIREVDDKNREIK